MELKKNLSWFLAYRFFKNQRRSNSDKSGKEGRKASPPALRIAMVGIAIGLAVMIVSICVVKGFQSEVSGKLSDFTSHIEVIDINSLGSPETYPLAFDDKVMAEVKAAPGVKQVQRFSQKMGIFKTESDFAGIALKGVGEDYDLEFLKRYIVKGVMPRFSSTRGSNEIVISQTLANKLGLNVGDKVYSYYFANTIKQRRFKVVGIYNTYMKQFDNTFVWTDLYTVNQLNRWRNDQCSGLEVRLQSFDFLPLAQHEIVKKVGGKSDHYGKVYSVLGIRENPNTASVLSWLELLDLNVMVILVIMICVSGFTMISGLLILILERTTTIGVLKALGATNRRIRHTFLCYAALIVSRGMLWGNVIGLGVVYAQEFFHIVRLDPEVYYIGYAPIEVNWLWIIGLNVATLCVTMVALVVPSFLVSRVQPAKAIQFD